MSPVTCGCQVGSVDITWEVPPNPEPLGSLVPRAVCGDLGDTRVTHLAGGTSGGRVAMECCWVGPG